jgi:hypothetical protein
MEKGVSPKLRSYKKHPSIYRRPQRINVLEKIINFSGENKNQIGILKLINVKLVNNRYILCTMKLKIKRECFEYITKIKVI